VLRRVAIVLDLDEPLPPVHCDRIQIQQVLLNLIVNAFAAMRDTGQRERRLIVRTRAETDGVTLSVHDTGTGIAPQHLARLFDQFFTTKPDGLGVGLSIAHSIVAAHGGRIWATNNSDRGATFHVVLPFTATARGQ
jgi:two-component system sensor kinase FixL